MTRLIALCALGSLVALAGCSKPDPDKRMAGKWKTEASIERLEVSGVPRGAEAQFEAMKSGMKAQMKSQFAKEECLTGDMAASEDITKGFEQGLASGGNCTFPTRKVGGGKIEIAGTCQMGPSKMAITMEGTTAPEKVDVNVTMKGGAGAGGPGLDLAMKIVNTRVGECSS